MEGVSVTTYFAVVSIVFSIMVGYIFLFSFAKRIGLWGIFGKAGEKEWKSMIPIYNQITLLKMCKLSPWLVLLKLAYIIPVIGFLAGREVSLALIIVSIGYVCYRFIISIRLGDAFKKGDVFSFFLALFPSILYPVLGCSKKETFTELPEIKRKKKSKKEKEENNKEESNEN